MKNAHIAGQIAEMNLPRNAMSKQVRPVGPGGDFSVSSIVEAAFPQPATVGLVYERPEAFLNRSALAHHAAGIGAPMPPKANAMSVAQTAVAARWLAAIRNRAYRFFSHFDTSHVLVWSGLKLVLTHRFSPHFVPEKSEIYNAGGA